MNALQTLLEHHQGADAKERYDLKQLRKYAQLLEAPLSRSQWPAHFTGSAVVIDPPGARVVMVHHAKLNRWLQPGGHPEPGDESLLETGLREAREETGLEVTLHPTAPRPFDVDVHVIPARQDEPEHRHLDVRVLVVASNPEALRHDPAESHGAQWLTWDEAFRRADEGALLRLLTKARDVGRG